MTFLTLLVKTSIRNRRVDKQTSAIINDKMPAFRFVNLLQRFCFAEVKKKTT